MCISGWTGIRNLIFGYLGISWNMSWRLVETGFSSCFAKFDDFSKFHSTLSMFHFEKSSNMEKMWQKMKKSLVQLAFNTFLQGTAGTRCPDTRISGNRSATSVYCISGRVFKRRACVAKIIASNKLFFHKLVV